MGLAAQIRALTAATDMPVHRIGRGNASTQSTHMVHAYWWKGMVASSLIDLQRI